jgi:hypothetical protein
MLDGLDQVEWGRLQHAFGTAEDVPHLIRALQSPSLDQHKLPSANYMEIFGTRGPFTKLRRTPCHFLLNLRHRTKRRIASKY